MLKSVSNSAQKRCAGVLQPALLLLLAACCLTHAQESDRVFKLYKMKQSLEAKCLDGSPSSFYFRSGDPKKWIILFQGGAWCGELTIDGTLKACYERSQTNLGSSHFLRKTQTWDGLLSNQAAVSGEFLAYSIIVVNYCDGTGHQGYSAAPYAYETHQLWFRGQANTQEMLRYAIGNLGMNYADTVIVTGQSAGGLAAFTWVDYIAQLVHQYNAQARIVGAPDSGIFLDFPNSQSGQYDFSIKFQNFMSLSNKDTPPPNTKCVQQHANEQWKCLFAQYSIATIASPVFIIQSLYDTYSLPVIAGVNCTNDASLNSCTPAQMAVIDQYFNQTLAVVQKAVQGNTQWGAWAIACLWHVYTGDDIRFNGPTNEVPELSQTTCYNGLVSWFNGKERSFIDTKAWPNNRPCSNYKPKSNKREL